MTIHDWLAHAKSKLTAADIATAELDSLVLLQDALGKNKAFILAHPEIVLNKEQQVFLKKSLLRRINHEPMAYIRRKVEFYGREFFVDESVLVPRPETETMIDVLKDLVTKNSLRSFADIGTGSGAIGITAQLEFPGSKVYATDIDKKCLKVSEKNNRVFKTTLKFLHGDLFEPLLNEKVDTVLANLPYVPNDFGINKAALNEPHLAIFGGDDGLDLYRKLFDQLLTAMHTPKWVLTESLPFQHEQLNKIASQHGYKLDKTDDFIQVFTVPGRN